MNAFDIFGIPSEFGLLLLTLSLILFLSPFFSGVDFGVIKIPALKVKSKKVLKFAGPILILGTISLFLPFWSRYLSPLVIQNLRISQSDTDYRFEITVKNINTRVDGIINHIDLYASDSHIFCLLGPTEFKISDRLVVEQGNTNQVSLFTEMTENQDTQFTYKVTGTFEIGACDERTFSLGFDSSILVPKDSTVQFHILLPRNLRVTETSGSSNIADLLDVTKDDILENYPYVRVAIWCVGAKEPVIFSK